MRVGLALPVLAAAAAAGERPAGPGLATAARRAEELGFDSVWAGDLGAAAGEVGGADPLVVLGAVARRTHTARIGTWVLRVDRRPPAVAAKALATIDILSGGRLTIAVGEGPESPGPRSSTDASGPPDPGGERFREAVHVLTGVLGGERFSFAGAHYQVDMVPGLPRPVQRPRPPVWVAGQSPQAMEVAARHGDGWTTGWSASVHDYRRQLRAVHAACERAGRDPAGLACSVALVALAGEDARDLERRFHRLTETQPEAVRGAPLGEWRAARLVGTVAELREQRDAWEAVGLAELIVSAGGSPFRAAPDGAVELLAEALT